MTTVACDVPDLTGRSVMITGTSASTGAELGTAFARRNADDVLSVHNIDEGEQVANAIREKAPDTVMHVR